MRALRAAEEAVEAAAAAAVCTPSGPPCPTSSCVRVRAARRGRRPSTEGPRPAGAPAPPPARHSVQEAQRQDCPPKTGTRPVPLTLLSLLSPEVKHTPSCVAGHETQCHHVLLFPVHQQQLSIYIRLLLRCRKRSYIRVKVEAWESGTRVWPLRAVVCCINYSAYCPFTQLDTGRENRVHWCLCYFLWTFDRRRRRGEEIIGRKNVLSVVKGATSVPAGAEQGPSEGSGAVDGLTPLSTHAARTWHIQTICWLSTCRSAETHVRLSCSLEVIWRQTGGGHESPGRPWVLILHWISFMWRPSHMSTL